MSTTSITTGVEHVDVLIVGAGISGIGAAYYLQTEQPDKTFAILEARGATGGTWDLFRYPGIRSDSDLHTFSYEFKPWEDDKAIAGAPRDPRLPARDGRRERHRRQDPAPPQGAQCRLVNRRRPVARRDRAHRHRRAADDELRLALLRRRLLPLRPGLHPGIRGPRALRRPDRASAALARGPRLQRQARRRDRQRRHRRHPDPGDGRHRRARDDAAALAHLRHAAAFGGRHRQRVARAARREAGLRNHPAQEHHAAARDLPVVPAISRAPPSG